MTLLTLPKIKTTILCLWTLATIMTSATSAQPYADGVWNGKPWPKDKLLAGVAKGDPDALAEWVMCSQTSELGIKYDPVLTFQRATQLAKQNHALGITCLAQCYLWSKGADVDQPRGIALLEKASKLGHPHAKWWLGQLIRRGDGGCEIDKKRGIALIREAEKAGAIYALLSKSWMANDGDAGVVDLEKSAEYMISLFEKHNNLWAATELKLGYDYARGSRFGGVQKYISKALMEKCRQRIAEAAALDHPFALEVVGWHFIKNGNPHRGIPYVIRAARAGEGAAHSSVYYLTNSRGSGRIKKFHTTDANHLVRNQAMRLYYRSGRRGDTNLLLDFIWMLQLKKQYTPQQERDLKKILHAAIREEQYDNKSPFLYLGVYYCDKANATKGGDKKTYERGLAMLRYACDYGPGANRLAYMQAYEDGPHYNAPEAICSLDWLIKLGRYGEGAHPVNVRKKLMDKMTPDQIKQYQKLKETGYPRSNTTRKQAFDHLQKSGDLPAHWIYQPLYQDRPKQQPNQNPEAPEEEEEEEEEDSF